jgi:hypothetical protein
MNKGFLENFAKEKSKPLEILQEWWGEETPFVSNLSRAYNTQYFKLYKLLIAMICKLYGEENCMHFKHEWTTIAHGFLLMGQISLEFLKIEDFVPIDMFEPSTFPNYLVTHPNSDGDMSFLGVVFPIIEFQSEYPKAKQINV